MWLLRLASWFDPETSDARGADRMTTFFMCSCVTRTDLNAYVDDDGQWRQLWWWR